MPWFPNPNGGAPIQATTNPNPAGGSYGLYSDPSYSGPSPSASGSSSGDGGGGGGGSAQSSSNLDAIAQKMLNALASGNKAAFDEAVREFDANHTLDQAKFDASVSQFNQTQADTAAGLTGTYNGAPTLAAQAQAAGLSGMYNGAPTEAARQFNTTATQSYLGLLSNLKGANDPFQYLRTLQGTPGGMADIVNAAAGRYQLGGTASGEIAPRATIQGQVDNMNNAQPGGSNSQDPNLQGMPAASQIDSRNYNRMLPSQQAALWSAYQYGSGPSGAMSIPDAQKMYQQSMPNYAGPSSGNVRLFTA